MVRVNDLPEQTDGVFLYCPKCGERSSATRGDYFMLDPDTKLRCGNHRPLADLQLARETRQIEVIQ